MLRKIWGLTAFLMLFLASVSSYAQAVKACIDIPDHTITDKSVTICKGTVFNLNGSNCGTATNVGYQWQNVSYNPPPTLNVRNLPTTDSGMWVLRVRDQLGNTDFDTVHVRYHPSTPFAIHNDPDLIFKCKKDPLVLQATDDPSLSNYNWYINDISTPSVGTEPTLSLGDIPDGAAEYIAVAEDSYGCSVSDTIYVWELESPPVDLGPDIDICEGESVTLTSLATQGGMYQYMWSTGANTESITVDSPGEYWFRAQGPFPFPCAATDTVKVNVNPAPKVDVGNDTTICFGSEVQLSATIVSEGTEPYYFSWTPSESLDQADIAEPLARPDSSTAYKVVVRDSGSASGCADSSIINVSVRPEIKVEVAFSDTLVCRNQEITLGANVKGEDPESPSDYTFSWMPAEGVSDPESRTPTVSLTSGRTIYARAFDALGCKDSAGIRVQVSNLMVIVENGSEADVCENDSIQLSAIASAGQSPYSYYWEPEAYFSATESRVAYLNPVDEGYVSVRTVDGRGCEAEDSINISLIPAPVVQAGANDTICEGTAVDLTGTVVQETVSPYSYRWVSAYDSTVYEGLEQELRPKVSGNFFLQAIDANNCSSYFDTTWVELIPAPFVSLGGADTSSCTGSSVVLEAQYEVGDLSFQWMNLTTNSALGNDNSEEVSEPGVYQLTVTEPVNNCFATVEKNVRYIETPLGVYISADTLFNVEQDYRLQAIAVGDDLVYSWSSTGGGIFTDHDDHAVVYVPSDDDIGQIAMSVTAENICGKVDTTMLVRGFKPIEAKSVLFVPNVFAPASSNPDNRTLKVFGENISSEGFVFEVFNRWGERVYFTTDFDEASGNGWTGQNHPMGVYTYVVKGKFHDGKEFSRTSNVTLMR
ncbi:gliding motility-associated C-terminal domain-containing protein [Cytophagaceae bacterium ABcell3]|nr:gliding motility-associated C-terminal domain-containing protein [Cytophagaceae bacterium ABcell3]